MSIELIGEKLTSSLVSSLPSLIAAAVLLLIGWVIGKVLGRIVEEILKRSKIDEYVFRTKKPAVSITKTTSVVVSWSIYLIFIQASVEILGIKVLVNAVGMLVDFLPKLIGAIYIILAGYAIGRYIKRKIEIESLEYSDLISKLAYGIVMYIAVTMALSLIGIDVFVLNTILLLFIGSLSVSLGVALGLTFKDILEKKIKKKKLRKRSK